MLICCEVEAAVTLSIANCALTLWILNFFPIRQVVEEKPVLICEVEYIKDEEDDTADTEEVKFSVGLPSCSFLALSQHSLSRRGGRYRRHRGGVGWGVGAATMLFVGGAGS